MTEETIDPPAPSPDSTSSAADVAGSPVPMPDLEPPDSGDPGAPLGSIDPAQAVEMLGDVDLDVKVELGRCNMLVGDVLRLTPGSVVELDKLAGDPVDVYVNERLVARGEVLVVNDNFCVRVSQILSEDG